MNIGDKFFTIAYTQDTRVIEVEVIGVENINGEEIIHIQNTEMHCDKWYISTELLREWKFKTREEATKELSEY